MLARVGDKLVQRHGHRLHRLRRQRRVRPLGAGRVAVGGELVAREPAQVAAAPARIAEQRVRAGHRRDAPLQRLDQRRGVVARRGGGKAHQRAHHGQRVARPVVHLAHQQPFGLLGAAAGGDVHHRGRDAHHLARGVAQRVVGAQPRLIRLARRSGQRELEPVHGLARVEHAAQQRLDGGGDVRGRLRDGAAEMRVLGAAVERGHRVVDGDEAQVGAEQREAHGGGGVGRLEPRGVRLGRGLRALQRVHVRDDAGPGDRAAHLARRRRLAQEPAPLARPLAVAQAEPALEQHGLAGPRGRHRALPRRAHAGPVVGVQRRRPARAERLVARLAGRALPMAVDPGHAALGVGEENDLRRQLDQRPQAQVAALARAVAVLHRLGQRVEGGG